MATHLTHSLVLGLLLGAACFTLPCAARGPRVGTPAGRPRPTRRHGHLKRDMKPEDRCVTPTLLLGAPGAPFCMPDGPASRTGHLASRPRKAVPPAAAPMRTAVARPLTPRCSVMTLVLLHRALPLAQIPPVLEPRPAPAPRAAPPTLLL